MHFITGGAFNGKRSWVKKMYNIKNDDCWLSAYENQPLPQIIIHSQDLLILEGAEVWLKELTEQYDATQSRKIWKRCLLNWLQWEKEKVSRNLVIIGTDITKGIVPLENENRVWRDVTGWAYQDTVASAGKADIIWYGINLKIK